MADEQVQVVNGWCIERLPSARSGKMRGWLWFDHPDPSRVGERRRTSAIAKIDVDTRTIMTFSGTRYKLGTPLYESEWPITMNFELA